MTTKPTYAGPTNAYVPETLERARTFSDKGTHNPKSRTSIDRLAEIFSVFQQRSRERLEHDFDEQVSADIEANPLGPHSDKTNRVLRAMHSLPIVGKELIYCLGPDGPWCLSHLTHGVPGNLQLTDQVFDNYEDAMRAVFRPVLRPPRRERRLSHQLRGHRLVRDVTCPTTTRIRWIRRPRVPGN